MQLQINHFIEENRKQSKQLETLRRLREESNTMQHEETRKLLYEAQYFKDKLDQTKTELHRCRRQLVEAERFQSLYLAAKDREDERLASEIQ